MNTFKIKSKHVVFWITLVVGIALCIGGIYMPALMVPGAMLVSSSLAFYQSSWAVDAPPTPINTPEVSPMLPIRMLEPIAIPVNVTNNYMIFSNGAYLKKSNSGQHIELVGNANSHIEPIKFNAPSQPLQILDDGPTI